MMAFLRNTPARGEPLYCGETGKVGNLVTRGPIYPRDEEFPCL